MGFIITGIILIGIFISTKDKKIYYLSLGDSLAAGQTPYNTIDKSYGDYVSEYLKDRNLLEFYTKKFSKSGYRSIDLLSDLKNNKEINEYGKKITLKDTLLIPSNIYDSFTYEVINNDSKLTNLVKDKNYYYYGINSINIKYDSNNIYELS